VYILDDREKALLPAAKLGMKTILFKSLTQLKKEFKSRNISY